MIINAKFCDLQMFHVWSSEPTFAVAVPTWQKCRSCAMDGDTLHNDNGRRKYVLRELDRHILIRRPDPNGYKHNYNYKNIKSNLFVLISYFMNLISLSKDWLWANRLDVNMYIELYWFVCIFYCLFSVIFNVRLSSVDLPTNEINRKHYDYLLVVSGLLTW